MHPHISILYEDADMLAINKPAGLLVHSNDRTYEPTVVDWLLGRCPEIKNVGDEGRPGIVHRLDRETSGILLIAKNQPAFKKLKKQFNRQQVRKVYRAFVYGRVKNDSGIIDRPIARSRRSPALWSATRGRKGREREAVTEYAVLKRSGGISFLELRPRTGRTHQIRVHLKAINYPIVCDKLYAPNKECALGFSRLALHARSLSFTLLNSKEIKIQAPYPKDFEDALSLLDTRC